MGNRSGGSHSTTSRFARWWSGWRVAIRVARRDARRYKWRSALIVAMVGLPVLLLTGGITLMATTDVSLAESVPRMMGSAQARVYQGSAPGRQIQPPNGHQGGYVQTAAGLAVPQAAAGALAVPGFAPDSGWTTSKVQKLTGGRAIQVSSMTLRVILGDRRPPMSVLGIDARDPMARGMTELVSGRWASTTSEIVVTEAGIASGLPSEGTLTTTGQVGDPKQMTIVGVATGQTEDGLPSLVALPEVSDPQAAFLVERADPVTWSDVRRMNNYGLLVQSREVFLNPPAAAELDPQIAQTFVSDQRQSDLVLLLAAVGLFIETTLLAGPAFAVSAARQRRSLALAASNGAEARQVRRYVLGQAVVLGVLSAAVAVVAGVLLTLAGLTWWQNVNAFNTGPFEISWPRVVGVFICAVVASVVAALIPARRIARLDIVSVLAGRAGDRTVHRGLPVAGVIVMVLSGSALIWSVVSAGGGGPSLRAISSGQLRGLQAMFIVGGTIGLVLGCLMVIPTLLALVGRLGTYLVLPMRLAARDTARQRGRSTPAVAAIMAAVAALTALSIGGASYTRQAEDTYQPQRPMGTGVISFDSEVITEGSVQSVLARFAPQLEVDPVGYVTDPAMLNGTGSWATLATPGCTEAQIVAGCTSLQVIGVAESLTNGTLLNVGTLSSLSRTLSLPKSQRAVLEGGGILVTDPRLIQNGQVRYVSGTGTNPPDGAGGATVLTITQRARFPAGVVKPRIQVGYSNGHTSDAWILEDTATRLDWPVRITQFDLTSPTGTIPPEVERAVADRLGDGAMLEVERGFQNPYWLILLIAFCVTGLLVLIASLISTALSLAESQNDMATLAAVGATRHTRRGIAASQAFVVAACGALLGVAVGLIPGVASAWPLTARGSLPPTIAIPWLPLVAVCVGVPLLAAGLAWIAVRRHPQMTRRIA